MRIDKNVLTMLDSFEEVGLKDLADSISTEIHNTEGTMIEALALGVQQYTIREKNKRTAMLLKRSRIPKECYLSNLLRYRARKLDYELVDEFMSLEFISEGVAVGLM